MKTWTAKAEEVDRNWVIIDAAGQTVGRLATQIATILRGKNKPTFTPHTDTGDFVVVINSKKVRFSGTKWLDKKYYSHSGYFGSTKEITAEELLDKNANEIITHAVSGMLPKNKLSNRIIKKLKVYEGAEHPHSAQKPTPLTVNN